jgi:nicotinate-nucleotide adenylyltransferase
VAGIYGGSFDPVHIGHLRTALELKQSLGLTEVRFVPSRDPPHRRAPAASAALRVEMLRQALADQPGFVVDERELNREGPSYTVATLESLRAEGLPRSLALILGMDAFLGLTTWHRWTEILALAHLVVAHRPGWQPPDDGPLGELLARRRTRDADDLREGAGRVLIHAVTGLDIASSDLRGAVGRGEDIRYLVPDPVRATILRHGCYAGATANG